MRAVSGLIHMKCVISIMLRSYSSTQLRNYSLDKLIIGLDSPDIQLGGAECPNHGLNEPRLADFLTTAELRR